MKVKFDHRSKFSNLSNWKEEAINCTIILDFWILFQEWWHQKTNETITLSTSHILCGWHDRTKHWKVLNYCLLLAKYRIFCTSLRGDILDFQNFLLFITGKLEILKEIATAKKNFRNFIARGLFYFNFTRCCCFRLVLYLIS